MQEGIKLKRVLKQKCAILTSNSSDKEEKCLLLMLCGYGKDKYTKNEFNLKSVSGNQM